MKLLAMLFIEFNAMIVRDGIDPQEAHHAFLAIDEYREAIAPDIEGASHPEDIFGGLLIAKLKCSWPTNSSWPCSPRTSPRTTPTQVVEIASETYRTSTRTKPATL